MNRRQIAATCLLLCTPLLASLAQEAPAEPVIWSTKIEPVKTQGGERAFRLQFEGRIAPGYIIYGPDFEAELGPRPVRLRLDADSAATVRDALQPTGTRRKTDKVFKVEYTYFQDQAKLSQLVVVGAGATQVSGRISGQTCYEADGTCALFNSRFTIPLP